MEMVRVGTFAHKHTSYATGRRFNIWYLVMRCPDCGAEKHPPQNTSRGKKYFCDNCKAAQHGVEWTACTCREDNGVMFQSGCKLHDPMLRRRSR